MALCLVQQWPLSSTRSELLKTEEELKNLQKLLKQLIFQWSFGKRRDAKVLRTLLEELRVLQPEELEQTKEYVVRA